MLMTVWHPRYFMGQLLPGKSAETVGRVLTKWKKYRILDSVAGAIRIPRIEKMRKT